MAGTYSTATATDAWKKVPIHTEGICDGVWTNQKAREWKCTWSEDNEKMSLTQCQKVLENVIVPKLREQHGLLSVQRVVCSECKEFKVICRMGLDAFDDWATLNFAPEEEVINALVNINGVSHIEAQTYTIMPIS
mmetsp:Transcript_11143/g.24586  ORF Transcript_11143/g.24586 Transcript_11143/m.24586 type:complete len:135 (+) Transcript_11143:52-456(+)